jgi:predicted small metal-binding protein
MRKGSKVTEYGYLVEITDLGSSIPFKASGNSLRELVRLVKIHVPTMVTYSKVYREMQENVGAYIALFTLPLSGKKIRRVVVQITSLHVTDEQIERFHAHVATLPQPPPMDFPE